MFKLKKSQIYKAVRYKPLYNIVSVLKCVFIFAFFISLAYFIYGLVYFPKELHSIDFGLIIFSLSMVLLTWNLTYFFKDYLRRSKRIDLDQISDDKINLADYLSVHVAAQTDKAINFAKKKGLEEPNSTMLLYFMLKEKNIRIDFILDRLFINKKELLKTLKENIDKTLDINDSLGYKYNLQSIMLEAAKAGIRKKGAYIKANDVFSALSKIEPNLVEELRSRNIVKADIDNLNYWQEKLLNKIRTRRKWWREENLKMMGSMAKDWTSGWTPTLDKYSIDLTEFVKRSGFTENVGHAKERSQAERVLVRSNENNVLLVGEPGCGKINIVRAMAERSFLGKTFEELNDKRFVQLDVVSILTTTESVEQVELILDKCFREAALAGNVILVLPDFDNYIVEVAKAGTIDISAMIAPYLRYPEFQFIALTSHKGLHKYIELKPHILSLFEKIDVPELNKEETLLLLEREVFFLENKYKLFIPYTTIKSVLYLADKYIHEIPFPRKGTTLLNDVTVYAKTMAKSKVVLPSFTEVVISEQTNIPAGKISQEEREVLLNLEDLIHERVINQSTAVKEISSALRRSRTEVKTSSGPMGTFLFMGPTGVGKTETAKALAAVYFGAETSMLRFDMSEFQIQEDIQRFIGWKDEPGILATRVRENPFSLVLLDEIEKAHPHILNLFLQVLDEGYMTDSLGRKIDFTNTIIIATSNAGYQIILDAIKEEKKIEQVKQDILDYVFKEGLFRPEFVNRFDAVVTFKALTKQNLLDIAGLRFKKLAKNLAKKQIELVVPEKVKQQIVELSYNPQFGAREMKRVIQDKIENEMARCFLANEFKEGDVIKIEPDSFKVVVTGNTYKEGEDLSI
jgi:ATP-dependent Clp protease ATP-binding subunit ClpC